MTSNPLAIHQTKDHYRWAILGLCALTGLCIATLPNMSLPPLFATISKDLGLSLVEVGAVWGMGSFPGIFFALIGGTLGDRFGTRRTLFATCLLTGVFGFGRSLAVDFNTLLIASLLYGVVQTIIPVVLFKVIHQWFPPEQLGMASGVTSAGFASGLMLGPLLSTSVLMPALGGWRQVLVFFAVLAIVISLAWLLVHPAEHPADAAGKPRVALRASLRHVMRLRDLWILGIAGLGISACFNGFTGYLPTYLKDIGWADLDADRALSAFFVTSLTAVIPLSILSDRFRLRRGFLIVTSLILATGISSLAFAQGNMIVLAVAATGFIFDATMAIMNATVLEVKGVDFLYAGTALGFANMIRYLGGAFSPPIGNALAVFGLNVPFLFWGGMALFACGMFAFVLRSHKAEAPDITAEVEAVG